MTGPFRVGVDVFEHRVFPAPYPPVADDYDRPEEQTDTPDVGPTFGPFILLGAGPESLAFPLTALPPDVTSITVHGKYVDYNGDAAVGTVTFSMTQLLKDADGKIFILPGGITAILDVDGEFTVDVIATDDPDLTPSGWTYNVAVALTGYSTSFAMEVPYNGGDIDLFDVIVTIPVIPGATYIQPSDLAGLGVPAFLVWDTDHYVLPTGAEASDILAATTRVKVFTGPTDPDSILGITVGSFDQWIEL